MGNAIVALVTVVLLVAATVQTASARQVAPGDWPHFNRDAGSSRYSPLNQINTTNVSRLQPAWTFSPVREGTDSNEDSVGIKVVPVVVNGVMYVPAGDLVVALDAASGKEIWRYTVAKGTASSKGVNYWPGNETLAPRIVFTTSADNLIALDAATGRPATGFGRDGVANMGGRWGGVPVVFRNVLAVGAGEFPFFIFETPQDPKAPGDSRGFDAVTGALKWVFHSVARPGEVGHETWLDDGWRDRSGTNVWGWHMTADEELGLLYLPIGGPASNYYGGDRPGDNLFGNSIVAVDGDTGKYRWHFQLVHHDLWDFDNPPAPVLINIQRDGQTIPALVQSSKTGWMFILDRRTGKPIFGVDERPVAKGDVPGEWYAPTQPFPLKPGPLARMSFSPEDMVTAQDTTATHAANCKALYDENGGFYNAGPFTPFLLHEDGAPPRSSINFPGSRGGTNWGGMATDQQRGYVFVYTQNEGSIGWVEKKKKGVQYTFEEAQSKLPYTRASIKGTSPYLTFSASAGEGLGNYPCQKPPWGQLNAVDANTGEILWQRPVGIAEHLPEGKRNTGLPGGMAGPTATAGGLVFFAALSDGRLRAFNSLTGGELWSVNLGWATTQPMTYSGSDGRQYLAITQAGAIHAFALPR